MSIEIKTPQFPESVEEGVVSKWHKKKGESVARDELLVDIETDKTVLEVVALRDGVLSEIIKAEGDVVLSSEKVGELVEAEVKNTSLVSKKNNSSDLASVDLDKILVNPAAKKLMIQSGLPEHAVIGSGKDGRVLKEDVLRYLAEQDLEEKIVVSESQNPAEAKPKLHQTNVSDRPERRVPMTRLRATVAKRLVEAQHNAAMLTTFNEVNMENLISIKNRYKDKFQDTHNGTKLGFMGFFVKAASESLKRFPAVNASIDGNEIVYHGFFDVGIAVSTGKGLVVPILRDADRMTIAEIESGMRNFAGSARDGKLAIEDMLGGTFTITNGGVFGSLLSTPILNPPQTAILGMHKIEDRPVVVSGEIVVRPMMYLALSYDHRMIDGREAVQFLVAIKDMVEDPNRMLLEI